MKKGTFLGIGVLIGYLFAPYIKKGFEKVKNGLVGFKNKVEEAAAKSDEEVPEPEEKPQEQEENED